MQWDQNKVRHCMSIAILLLICGYHASSLWLLVRMAAYILLLCCIKQLPKQKKHLNMALFVCAGLSLLLCVIGYFTITSHTILIWGLEVLAHIIDMIFLYSLATWILRYIDKKELEWNRQYLLIFCAVAAVASCLQLNIPVLSKLVVIAEAVSHIYFVFGFCQYIHEDTIEGKEL